MRRASCLSLTVAVTTGPEVKAVEITGGRGAHSKRSKHKMAGNMRLLPPRSELDFLESGRFWALCGFAAIRLHRLANSVTWASTRLLVSALADQRNRTNRIVSVARAYSRSIREAGLGHARPPSNCSDAKFVPKIPPPYHASYCPLRYTCRRSRRCHSTRAVMDRSGFRQHRG